MVRLGALYGGEKPRQEADLPLVARHTDQQRQVAAVEPRTPSRGQVARAAARATLMREVGRRVPHRRQGWPPGAEPAPEHVRREPAAASAAIARDRDDGRDLVGREDELHGPAGDFVRETVDLDGDGLTAERARLSGELDEKDRIGAGDAVETREGRDGLAAAARSQHEGREPATALAGVRSTALHLDVLVHASKDGVPRDACRATKHPLLV